MSLLDDFAHKCILMEKKRTPDGAGGYITAWEEGAEFLNYQSLDTSMEARKAEKDGVTSVYSWSISAFPSSTTIISAIRKRGLPIV